MVPWNSEDLVFDETRFKGIARLFPLQDLIMFPHVMQPLRIFEPRYRDLLNEALDSDGLIAMCMYQPGAQKQNGSRPPLLPYACLGKVVTHQRTDEGDYNLLLLGMRRVKLISELSSGKTFREAKVKLLDDYCHTEKDTIRPELQEQLTRRFQEFLPEAKSSDPAFQELLSNEIPLSVLTDLVSFALPMEFAQKRDLLAESDVDRRAEMLLIALGQVDEEKQPRRSFRRHGQIPPFSSN